MVLENLLDTGGPWTRGGAWTILRKQQQGQTKR